MFLGSEALSSSTVLKKQKNKEKHKGKTQDILAMAKCWRLYEVQRKMIPRCQLTPEVEPSSVTSSEGDTVTETYRGRGSPRSRKGKASGSDLRSKMVTSPKNKKEDDNIFLLGMGHYKRYHAKFDKGHHLPTVGYSCSHGTGYVSTKKTVAERADDTDKVKFASSNPYQPLYELGSQMPDMQFSGPDLAGDRLDKLAGNLGDDGKEIMEKTEKIACARSKTLRRKAKKICRLLQVEQGLKGNIKLLPKNIECGQLRSSVRSIYEGQDLTVVQELSIKTSQKAESAPCSFCSDKRTHLIDEWINRRYQPVSIDKEKLEKFAKVFRSNVPKGWNKKKTPYVPNGHATKSNSRRRGGNWNQEEFSEMCSVEEVWSSGKPRIITTFSEYNTRVLTPLHHSLYASLQRKGWLLLGNPTESRLRQLAQNTNRTNRTEWLSFDYSSATDNIKTAYVRRAVEILIEQGENVSEDETRCLRVVANLNLGAGVCESGQPMGSVMSFPLLCLINKTVVDLALISLLENQQIEFKEWTQHPCLINGDDLLTMSTSRGDLVSAVRIAGEEIGLKTNEEKTMRSPVYGEINSTVFENCVRQKKTNVASLWMGQDVCDVIGFARESTRTRKGFAKVVMANASRLARQKIKTVDRLELPLQEVLVQNSKINAALRHFPDSEEPEVTNLFPVVIMPADYCLTREEEDAALTQEVIRVRASRLWQGLAAEKKQATNKRKTITTSERELSRKAVLRLLRPKKPVPEKRTLRIFAETWENKKKEELIRADKDAGRFVFTVHHTTLNPFTADLGRLYGKSSIVALSEMIKTFKDKRTPSGPYPSVNRRHLDVLVETGGDPLREQRDYVSFD
jgi:hypothetical protein